MWGADEGDGEVLRLRESPLLQELGQSYEGYDVPLGHVREHHYVD